MMYLHKKTGGKGDNFLNNGVEKKEQEGKH